jgi:glycine dehydrogenase subunit 2
MNAILGKFKPGQAGFDVMHFNTHKTFSTPHGGGGPGAGPVAVGDKLVHFLPWPRVLREGGAFRLERAAERPTSIGRVRSYQGSVGVLVRAYAYLLAHGGAGLVEVSEDAVLNANYLRNRLADTFGMPFEQVSKHEFVASATQIKKRTGVRMLDIAKRLIDYGFHPPTIYFPLTVDECMLVEPTETESVETLDAFADALIEIVAEAGRDPDLLHDAPHVSPVRRLDEATAARQPDLRWRPMTGAEPVCPT